MMLYSSGTTGKPKGVVWPLSGQPAGTTNAMSIFTSLVEFDARTVYLCPAPLTHAAPIGWSLATQRMGGTVVLMERFDAEQLLAAIERHRVTVVQMVPTMFVRLLKLPQDVRDGYDVSSLRHVVHAAAPCAPDVKEQMIAWWGPIIDEYYSGTEGSGITYLTSPEWIAHRGSVGRPILGAVHVVDEDGNELPGGEVGAIYFSSGQTYHYHNDEAATAARRHTAGWTTLDDVGWVDADGYLYLTDRRSSIIVTGGVNIAPKESEDALISHPAVLDAAVIGIPHPELGEVAHAVVQLVDPARASDSLATELLEHCRSRLAAYKCPRGLDFVAQLPRQENGKLYKTKLRDHYWSGHDTHII
jgi:fatty-acyl-CoA synthase